MQKIGIDPIDTGVMRVDPRIVMQVDAGKHVSCFHVPDYVIHHCMLWCTTSLPTRPDAIVIRLPIQATPSMARCRYVTNEQR